MLAHTKGNPKIMVRGQKKFVAYYRVSTNKQGERGLGMAAQAACVEAFVRSHDGKILASFRELRAASATTGRNWTPRLTGPRRWARRS
jgi:DNA invertase Pin-like site-specific DNA recombinase